MPSSYYSSDNTIFDYALIVVKEDLSDYYHFNLGLPYNMYTSTDFQNYIIHATGFPKTIPGGDDNSIPPKMYTGKGEILKKLNKGNDYLFHNADLTYGNSGGPIYVKEKYTTGSTTKDINVVISICSRMHLSDDPLTDIPYNYGPTMRPIMLRFYLNNVQVKQTIESFS